VPRLNHRVADRGDFVSSLVVGNTGEVPRAVLCKHVCKRRAVDTHWHGLDRPEAPVTREANGAANTGVANKSAVRCSACIVQPHSLHVHSHAAGGHTRGIESTATGFPTAPHTTCSPRVGVRVVQCAEQECSDDRLTRTALQYRERSQEGEQKWYRLTQTALQFRELPPESALARRRRSMRCHRSCTRQ
jgi:hypothetical protein